MYHKIDFFAHFLKENSNNIYEKTPEDTELYNKNKNNRQKENMDENFSIANNFSNQQIFAQTFCCLLKNIFHKGAFLGAFSLSLSFMILLLQVQEKSRKPNLQRNRTITEKVREQSISGMLNSSFTVAFL